MVENGGGKKRNRNRNKNKNKGNNAEAAPAEAEAAPAPAAAPAAAPAEEPKPAAQPAKAQSAKKKSPSPPKEVKKANNGGANVVDNRSPEEKQADLIKNLAMDFPPYLSNFVELRAAEARFHAGVTGNVANGNGDKATSSSTSSTKSSLAAEIAKARQHIKNSLDCVDNLSALAGNSDLAKKVKKLEDENKSLKKVCDDLKKLVLTLEGRVGSLEKGGASSSAPAAADDDDDDDDVDLFGSDEDEEEDAEKVRIREERLKAYHEKKSKKPALIAKTSVLLDVKPWDDETDMDAMLAACKSITKEGLVWGASKLVPVGYGIQKLQVMCVVEDEKVSIDELSEQITGFEDFVQSVDIAAMSKI